MINYYFFRLCRERNAQGELRAVLHALPGQTTYDPAEHGYVDVNTNLKVQVPSVINSMVCRSTTGSIFGTEISGNTRRSARLPLYSRNEDRFYRANTLVGSENFGDDMMAAYRSLMGDTSENGPESGPADETRPTQQVSGNISLTPSQMLRTQNYIKAVAECNSMDTALSLSRLYDKMMIGVVKFSYRKSSDDSVREAFGTLNGEVINRMCDNFGPENDDEEARRRRIADGSHFFYYDIEKKAFRNFCTENFIGFEDCIYNATVETVNDAA